MAKITQKQSAKKASTKKAVVKKKVAKKVVVAKTRAKRHTKKLLVPHKNNDYRPHLIRAHGLIAVLVVALAAQMLYGLFTTGNISVLGRVSNIEVADLLASTNAERRQEGLPALQLNTQLSQAAFLKGQNMFTEQYWAHVSPSGTQPWKWFGDVEYNYSYAGENLAKNYPTAQATVEAWMGSETHRENILKNEFIDVGFAVVDGELQGKNTTLVVALYGAPVTTAAVQAASDTRVFSTSTVATTAQTPLAYFGSALQSISPVTAISLVVMALIAIVGVMAHHYRKQLPKAWQRSWRMHHGLYTFAGTIALGVLVVLATGGGQI